MSTSDVYKIYKQEILLFTQRTVGGDCYDDCFLLSRNGGGVKSSPAIFTLENKSEFISCLCALIHWDLLKIEVSWFKYRQGTGHRQIFDSFIGWLRIKCCEQIKESSAAPKASACIVYAEGDKLKPMLWNKGGGGGLTSHPAANRTKSLFPAGFKCLHG